MIAPFIGSLAALARSVATRGTLALAALALSVACSRDAAPPRPTEPSPYPSPSPTSDIQQAPARLNDTNLHIYWEGATARAAADLFARKQYQEARDAFSKLSIPSKALANRRKLLVGLCDAKLGNHKRAAQAFTSLLPALPFLASYLHWHAARSYFFSHNTTKALAQARLVDRTSIHRADADLLVGDILRRQDDVASTYQHYRRTLLAHLRGIRWAEARYYMATAAHSLEKLSEANKLWREILVGAPLSPWAAKARARLGKNLRLSGSELLARGHIFYRHNRSNKSEADFRDALKDTRLSAKQRCDAWYHRASSVYKLRDRKRAAPLLTKAMAACKRSRTADLYVKAAYQGGRALATLGENAKALASFSKIESEHPTHSYADDARLLRARLYEKLGDTKKAHSLLASIPGAYPMGDMRAEAMWRLAWDAYKARDYPKAIHWLRKQKKSEPPEGRLGAHGQAEYWVARSYEKLGKLAKSIAGYREVVIEYPLSYYSLLALTRLRETDLEVFREVKNAIRKGSKNNPQDGALSLGARSEYKKPGFLRAVEFLRLGLPRAAGAELRRLGFGTPPGRKPLLDSDAIDKAWAVSYLQSSLGNASQALWATRWLLTDFRKHWPVDQWRQRWDIAFPRGYPHLIRLHAKAQGVPSELVSAFVREESGFDPRQESSANAIGLSQLIMPTAKRFAKDTGIIVSRETLRDPSNNLAIATRFMAFLMNKWAGDIFLVAPSYNAGENAVMRWMGERGSWPRDEFAEEIPYDETRRYAKRVIASYFAYLYLYRGEIPLLRL